jgi:ABC-type sugar transport system, ATPase component
MDMLPELHIGNVSKSFAAIHALRDVTLDLFAGHVTAILGENGAGKTTLVNIVSGAVQPDSGELAVDGRPVSFGSPLDAMRLGVFVVHQEPQLFSQMTIAQNLFIYELGERPLTHPYSPARSVERAIEALDRLGLSRDLPDPSQQVRGLSAAGRQLVALARALIRQPRVLLLDEPNSSLTRNETDRLFTLVRRLRDQGVAVALVSHRLSEVYEIADDVVILRDGQKVAEDTPSRLPVSLAIQAMAGRRLREAREVTVHAATKGVATQSAPNPKPETEGREVLRLEHCTGQRFRDVSFSIHAGEIVGLAGLVGSGRTEIARAVVGADPMLGGTVWFQGRRVRFRNTRQALQAGVAFVAEERRTQIFYGQTVRFNITSSVLDKLERLGFIRQQAQNRLATGLASQLSIRTPSLASPVTSLSGGNQQKLLMARLLSVKPTAVILDEPTRGVDVATKAEIYDILRGLAREGLAIWFISSELDEIIELADRVFVVRGGRVVESLPGGPSAAVVVASVLGERLMPAGPDAL